MALLPFLVFLASTLVIGLVGWHWSRSEHGPSRNKSSFPAKDATLDATPLTGYWRRLWAGNMCSKVLADAGPDAMLLRSHGGVKLTAALALFAGLWQMSLGIQGLFEAQLAGDWLGVGWWFVGGVPFTLAGLLLWFDVGRVSFDRLAGTISQRRFCRPALTIRLADVIALQCIWGGRHLSDGDEFDTYQLNLVVNDAERPRLNLLEHHDLKETQALGQRLADFLSLPCHCALPPS